MRGALPMPVSASQMKRAAAEKCKAEHVRAELAKYGHTQTRGEHRCLRHLTHRVFIKLLVKIN